MGIINGSSLAASYVEYRSEFKTAFDAAPAEMEAITSQQDTSKRSVKMFWGGQVPTMKQYVGDLKFDQIEAYNWEISVSKWGAGLEINRDDIEDDELDWVRPYIAGMGTEARQHPMREVAALLEAGDTGLCYDGQYFFDTDHVDGAGPTQSNKITGALTADKVQEMRQTMARLKDTKSRPVPRRLTHLLVPPELEKTALTIATTEFGSSGATNIEKGRFQVLVSPHLTSAVKYYGFDLSTPFRPIHVYWRARPEFTAQDNPTDENAFVRETFRYKARSRFGRGYGLWQFAAMSTGV